jgi:hypothetical protein
MAINVLFMAPPLFMKAEDSRYTLPNLKFHISFEYSMNRAAYTSHDCSCNALLRRTIFASRHSRPLQRVRKGRQKPGKDDGERACGGRHQRDRSARIEQGQQAMRLTLKVAWTIGSRPGPNRFEPCSMGTSLDSFQFGGPLAQ